MEVGADPERLSWDRDLLLSELRELGFDDIGRPIVDSAPPGTRAGDVTTVASIAAIVSSPAVVQAATEIVKSWLIRRTRGAVRIKVRDCEIEISAASTDEWRRLTAELLAILRAVNHGET
ncbi:hypothetical protein AB0H49_33235 [Nocardia sp. NPDC050713]|uniref:effector-associated constant component EACC1 n=1 Tax=Nocardia sp. NPDC050713 TaxID=3154511 RepID=UPI0033C64C32